MGFGLVGGFRAGVERARMCLRFRKAPGRTKERRNCTGSLIYIFLFRVIFPKPSRLQDLGVWVQGSVLDCHKVYSFYHVFSLFFLGAHKTGNMH